MPEEALYRSLAQLQAAEFLYETSLFPEPAYTFKHALTHEVAYGSLLQERRQVLHARLDEALEARVVARLDDQVERLAQHALRGEAWEKALTCSRQAGDKARTHSAYREAVICYEQVPPPSSSSRAGCPSPATHPVCALRCAPAASSAGQPLARGVPAAPRRGQQRAGWQQGGMGWADAGSGKGRLIFLSPATMVGGTAGAMAPIHGA